MVGVVLGGGVGIAIALSKSIFSTPVCDAFCTASPLHGAARDSAGKSSAEPKWLRSEKDNRLSATRLRTGKKKEEMLLSVFSVASLALKTAWNANKVELFCFFFTLSPSYTRQLRQMSQAKI